MVDGDVAAQTKVHDAYPAVDTYFTECSGGDWSPAFADNLVWNVRTLIIGATRNWARGVLLWNVWEQVDAARRLIVEPGPFGAADLKGRLPA